MDSRLKSLTENFTNLAVGFPINYVANLVILPHYASGFTDLSHSAISAAEIGVWFTIVSVVRSYGLRRLFERFGEKENFYTLIIRLGKHIKTKFYSEAKGLD